MPVWICETKDGNRGVSRLVTAAAKKSVMEVLTLVQFEQPMWCMLDFPKNMGTGPSGHALALTMPWNASICSRVPCLLMPRRMSPASRHRACSTPSLVLSTLVKLRQLET